MRRNQDDATLEKKVSTAYKCDSSDPQYEFQAASPTLASPWDNPSYSQPASPSLLQTGILSDSPHSDRWLFYSHDSGRRPTRLPHINAAITKRGSLALGHRQNPSIRWSTNASGQTNVSPISATDTVPLWQQQLVRSASLSRSNSSRSKRGCARQSSSRPVSRDFAHDRFDAAPTSTDFDRSVENGAQVSALANALEKLELMQHRRSSCVTDQQSKSSAPRRSSYSASFVKQAQRFSATPYAPDSLTQDERASQEISSGSAQRSIAPGLPATAPSCEGLPTSGRPSNSMHVSSTTIPSFAASSANRVDAHAPTAPTSPLSADEALSGSEALPAFITPATKRGSLSRSSRLVAPGSLLRGAMLKGARETLSTPLQLQSVQQWKRASATSPADFLSHLQNAQMVSDRTTPPLVLDVRPLHLFLGDTGRIKGSVNVNFPSLLVKRFRKGNTTSFGLESFITTEAGKARFRQACPGGDLSKTRIYVVDDHINPEDFERLASSGSVGAVLVDILTRDLEGDASQKGQTLLAFLSGSLADALELARQEQPMLYVVEPDDGNDVKPPRVSAGIDKHTQAENGTPAAESARLVPSRSEISLAQAATPRRKARTLLHLELPESHPSPAVARIALAEVKPPPSPGLFRSYSDPEPQTLKELPESLIPGLQRKRAPPIALQRLDTSEHVRQLSSEGPSSSAPAAFAQALTPSNGSFANRASSGRQKARPPNLAPPRSIQEMASLQASTPTAAFFARAANVRLTEEQALPRWSCDLKPETPKTPLVSSHSRNISTDSTVSSSSAQYPSFNTNSKPIVPPSFQCRAGSSTIDNNINTTVSTFDVSVIIPGFLYLGPEPVRESDVKQLESVGVKRILNMAAECDTFGKWRSRFEVATIPMRDSLAEVGVQDRIREACVLLDDADLTNKPTYVHCKAGKSRSVTIILAFLVHRYVLSKYDRSIALTCDTGTTGRSNGRTPTYQSEGRVSRPTSAS